MGKIVGLVEKEVKQVKEEKKVELPKEIKK